MSTLNVKKNFKHTVHLKNCCSPTTGAVMVKTLRLSPEGLSATNLFCYLLAGAAVAGVAAGAAAGAAAFLGCFFALAGLAPAFPVSVLATSAFIGSAAFGASTFLSAVAGAATAALAAGAAAGAGAPVWAKEVETKPAATIRAISGLSILNLLERFDLRLSVLRNCSALLGITRPGFKRMSAVLYACVTLCNSDQRAYSKTPTTAV
jgi:hypothetical protein